MEAPHSDPEGVALLVFCPFGFIEDSLRAQFPPK
jgi:hypothetical protein